MTFGKKKLVIFGAGEEAALFKHYIDTDGVYEVVAFTAHEKYIAEKTFLNLPVVPFENLGEFYPPSGHEILISILYNKMNRHRRRIFEEAKGKGYFAASYISPKAAVSPAAELGEGTMILPGVVIEPFVKIGKGNVFWSGAVVCHHTEIGDFNFLASGSVVAGHTRIKNGCFIGIGGCVKHRATLEDEVCIGAGVYFDADKAEEGAVYVPARPVKLGRKSVDLEFFN